MYGWNEMTRQQRDARRVRSAVVPVRLRVAARSPWRCGVTGDPVGLGRVACRDAQARASSCVGVKIAVQYSAVYSGEQQCAADTQPLSTGTPGCVRYRRCP